MNANNRAVLQALLDSLEEFVRGRLTVEDVQRRLQLSLNRLDSEAGSSHDDIRLAEADLEEIRFTMLLDEQRPAAVFRLDPLRAAIADRLGVIDGMPPTA